MSTANFRQNSFPLYCLDDSEMEWWESRDIYDDLTEYGIKPLNNELRFFEISAISGYYCGLQLWVEHTRYAENAGFYDDCDTDDVTNEDCRYYLDMCRSEAIRKYEAERRKVLRLLEKLADAYGFEEYVCIGRFSNGEAWYEKASNNRARIKAACASVL